MAVTISFFGGVREVTGSNFLFENGRGRVLVDCGLRQGCHFCEGRNRQPFPYDPATISAVVITHAHVDHIGLLPKLVRDGFRGPIFATEPTRDLAALMLEDSAALIGKEAADRNEEPPYDADDVPHALERFEPVPYHETRAIAPGFSVTFADAGHVLGSAIAVLESHGRRVVCSGDLGNSPTPLLRDRETIDRADAVLIEATYGDRLHEDRQVRRTMLRDLIRETVRKRGVLLIPAFAFERTQEILAELNDLVGGKEIPMVPVFLDSPLAVKITAVYQRHPSFYNEAARAEIIRGDIPFRFPGLRFMTSVEESKAINDVPPPKVIISGSGMLEGGRILHHARRYLPDDRSTLLIIGYQAAGSLGRRLLQRPAEVRIFGEAVPVRARVKAIGGYSAHADQTALLSWLSAISGSPRTFVVHGEEAASLALRQAIRENLGREAVVPMPGDRAILEGMGA